MSPSRNLRTAIRANSQFALTKVFFSLVPFTNMGIIVLRKSVDNSGVERPKYEHTRANNCFTSLLAWLID